ncbi:TetR/AcrR family transcriptional regulator [Actinomadura darangshiensis]|nr:TetR family transcriptional regulator [Actinomadura darangshiensis]
MTDRADHTMTRRGQERREQLLQAGVDLLAEGGWAAVTAKAVAERNRIRPGLLHHYFGGLPGFHIAIAARAHALVLEPLLDVIVDTPDITAAAKATRGAVAARFTDGRYLRLMGEILVRALRDPTMGTQRRNWTHTAHEKLVVRLEELHPQWSLECRTDTAALLAALLDGLIVQQILAVNPEGDSAAPAIGGAESAATGSPAPHSHERTDGPRWRP